MSELLHEAIAAIRAGDQATGRRLLSNLLRSDPRNEIAWLWLAGAVPTDEQRRDCLLRVLAINPANPGAQQGLAQLNATAPAEPSATVVAQPTDAPTITPPAPAPASVQAAAAHADESATAGQSAVDSARTSLQTEQPEQSRAPISQPLLAYRLLSRPLFALLVAIPFTLLSFGAALEAASGRIPKITGRYQLYKSIYAWLIVTLGPIGVLVVGGLVCLALLAWLVLRIQTLNTFRRTRYPASERAPKAAKLPRPKRQLSPAAVRAGLLALIGITLVGFGAAYLLQPKPIPGLIEGGMAYDLRNRGLTSVTLQGIPEEQLVVIDLSYNPLEELPATIGDYERVEMLFVTNTNLTRLPPEIGRMTNLRQLVLANNRLTELPAELGQLRNLEVLDVQGNRLQSLPPELLTLPKLRQVNAMLNPLDIKAVRLLKQIRNR